MLSRSAKQDALPHLERVLNQDLDPDPERGGRRIAKGTAKGRQISIRNPFMRHGRGLRSTTTKRFKWLVAKGIDHGPIFGETVQPANPPEHQADTALPAQVEKHSEVAVLPIDRVFLAIPRTTNARMRRSQDPPVMAPPEPGSLHQERLAHGPRRQHRDVPGRRGPYVGIEENIFDICRYAVMETCLHADRIGRWAA